MTEKQGRRADMPAGDMRYRSMNMGGRYPPDRSGRQIYSGQNPPVPENGRRESCGSQGQQAVDQNTKPADSRSSQGFDLGRMFGGIKLDEEKIIIILLIVILARNGAELPLLAALGYLLM